MTYQEIINKLNDNEQFSFSRFGDGEFNCMRGKEGSNCDDHTYFKDLGVKLALAWNEPRGVVALQRYAKEIYAIDSDLPSADVLHHASMESGLKSFFEALRGRTVILVGPQHIHFDFIHYKVLVTLKNAWLLKEYVQKELKPFLVKNNVILYACGMMAEVLIWENYSDDYTQIDVGSVFDPYCGVISRQYHKKLKL